MDFVLIIHLHNVHVKMQCNGAFQATRNSCFHDFILTTYDLLAFHASHESRLTNKQTCDWINMNINFSTPYSYVCCFDYNVRNYVTLPFHIYVYFLTVGHRCLRSIRGSRCLRWWRQKTNWEYIDHIRVHRSWVTSWLPFQSTLTGRNSWIHELRVAWNAPLTRRGFVAWHAHHTTSVQLEQIEVSVIERNKRMVYWQVLIWAGTRLRRWIRHLFFFTPPAPAPPSLVTIAQPPVAYCHGCPTPLPVNHREPPPPVNNRDQHPPPVNNRKPGYRYL